MAKLFICYRRADSEVETGYIYNRLVADFGRGQVFMDTGDMPLGVDFRVVLEQQIRGCDILLAVIGGQWLKAQDEDGQPRLFAERDYVRTEIEIALDRGIPVVPVLLGEARLPKEAQLPTSIARLAYHHSARVHPGREFQRDMDDLVRRLQRQLAAGGPTVPDKESFFAAAPRPQPQYSPQITALLAALADLKTPPERRLVIGDELAALGDLRPGVGLRADGLPDLDWVAIPAGPFLYGEAKAQRETAAFEIARYPITNAQYQAFIDAGGYREARWWAGLAKRIDQPSDPRWSQPNRPRDTVTWYEAVAFTRWLSAALGEQIRLPTEWEWERAARGTDGRAYPWGDGYQVGYANVDETEQKDGPTYLKQTTAVGMYPQGASPEGVLDLAGNVWEWCLNSGDQPAFTDTTTDTPRVLRGGAWINSSRHARAAHRYWLRPGCRNDRRGLRVLRGSPIGL